MDPKFLRNQVGRARRPEREPPYTASGALLGRSTSLASPPARAAAAAHGRAAAPVWGREAAWRLRESAASDGASARLCAGGRAALREEAQRGEGRVRMQLAHADTLLCAFGISSILSPPHATVKGLSKCPAATAARWRRGATPPAAQLSSCSSGVHYCGSLPVCESNSKSSLAMYRASARPETDCLLTAYSPAGGPSHPPRATAPAAASSDGPSTHTFTSQSSSNAPVANMQRLGWQSTWRPPAEQAIVSRKRRACAH